MEKHKLNIAAIWKFGWPVLVLLVVWGVSSLGPRKNQGAGYQLYTVHCGNCHMEDGTGLVRLIPPLAGADFVLNQSDQLACIIRHGMNGPVVVNGITFNEPMPANDRLRPVEIHAIINYIRTAWDNGGTNLPFSEIEQQLESCK